VATIAKRTMSSAKTVAASAPAAIFHAGDRRLARVMSQETESAVTTDATTTMSSVVTFASLSEPRRRSFVEVDLYVRL
jgi:hypothetical protein